jgi:hypothetical protein
MQSPLELFLPFLVVKSQIVDVPSQLSQRWESSPKERMQITEGECHEMMESMWLVKDPSTVTPLLSSRATKLF